MKHLNAIGRAMAAQAGELCSKVRGRFNPAAAGGGSGFGVEPLETRRIMDMSLMPNALAGIDISYSVDSAYTDVTIRRADDVGDWTILTSIGSHAGSYTDSIAITAGHSYHYAIFDDSGNLIEDDTLYGPPLAVNDGGTTSATALQISHNSPTDIDVLGNDCDPAGASLTVDAGSLSQPSHGTVSINEDGSLHYEPTLGYSGADSFSYKASNGATLTNQATVHLFVAAPDLSSQSIGVEPSSLATNHYSLGTLDSNDYTQFVTVSSTGSMSLTGDGDLSVPTTSVCGDQLVYRIENSFPGASTVQGNMASAGVGFMQPYGDTSADVTAGELTTAPAGTLLTVPSSTDDLEVNNPSTLIDTSQVHGTLSVAANGSYSYTPDSGFSGQAFFTYQVKKTGTVPTGQTGLSLYITQHFNVAPAA